MLLHFARLRRKAYLENTHRLTFRIIVAYTIMKIKLFILYILIFYIFINNSYIAQNFMLPLILYK
jgi:hypothetical protein